MTYNDNSFLGRGWSFPPGFNKVTGSVEMVENEEDIRQSILIFLNTRQGERMMRLNYGSKLHDHIFHSNRYDVLDNIAEELRTSLQINEPRILVNAVNIDAAEAGEGRIHIEIDYTVEATNVRNNLVYPFFLIEGTHI